jgi:hypothetical protein
MMLATVLLALALIDGPDQGNRFAKTFAIPASFEVIIVAEGDFEPRSIGSYSLRVYGDRSGKFPLGDFVIGLIRPRSGTIEAVAFDDVDGDNTPEIVVIMRSVGSGGYVSADAFRYKSGSLDFVTSVSDLDKGADPIKALRGKFKRPDGKKD